MTRVVEGLGRSWFWPSEDTECVKVIFDWISDLDRTIALCPKRRTAIIAGGNMGVWPWRAAQSFERVITAEPDAECFTLMDENLAETRNVRAYRAALLDVAGYCSIHVEPRNRGAQYVEPLKRCTDPAAIFAITIDSLAATDCDLIYLDIEGAELKALQGARETIARDRPVIALEDKDLSRRFATGKYDAEKWLEREFGYRVVKRFHNDVILTCA